MIIVCGHLQLRPGTREAYLDGCREVVRLARAAPGCLDFALAPDLVEPDRVVVLEVWTDPDSLAAFRGDGIADDQAAAIVSVAVREHDASPR
ncbi:putative quinol monooxygenase [Nocardioides marmoraquaticus]